MSEVKLYYGMSFFMYALAAIGFFAEYDEWNELLIGGLIFIAFAEIAELRKRLK